MAIFDRKSRYVKNATTYQTTDRRGRTVVAVTPASAPAQTKLGIHRRKQGQRLDHLATFYIQDANGFWRIAELNEVMLPDALAEADLIDIPTVLK
jgi:hypothetical protein